MTLVKYRSPFFPCRSVWKNLFVYCHLSGRRGYPPVQLFCLWCENEKAVLLGFLFISFYLDFSFEEFKIYKQCCGSDPFLPIRILLLKQHRSELDLPVSRSGSCFSQKWINVFPLTDQTVTTVEQCCTLVTDALTYLYSSVPLCIAYVYRYVLKEFSSVVFLATEFYFTSPELR